MALKRRFQHYRNLQPQIDRIKPNLKLIEGRGKKSQVNTKPPKLSLVKPNPLEKKIDALKNIDQFLGDNTESFKKRLIVYRRINELYQEKGLHFELLMSGLLELIVKVTGAEGGSLWITHKEKSEIQCKIATGTGSENVLNLVLPMSKGIVGWVVDHNQSAIVYDTSLDERFHGSSDRKQKNGFSTKSLIASPLFYGGEVLGVIEVVNKQTDDKRFNDEDKAFLDDICTPTAMHIKTSLAIQRQEAFVKRMGVFKQLHESFSETIDLNKLLGIVLTRAIELLQAEVGSLWLTTENDDKIECKIAEGPTKNKVIGVKLDKGTGIIGWVIENKKSSIVEDCSKDSHFSSEVDKKINFVTRSLISSPLCVKDECIGAIQIINKKGEELLFNKEDLNFLELFASSAAMYIKNARLFASEKKAKELSALIQISKEITSTLDLDAVLLSIVNLSSNIIEYTRGAVSRKPIGKKEYLIQAMNGQEKIDLNDEETKDLGKLHNKIVESGKDVLINSEAYQNDPNGVAEIKKYLKKKNLKSFWAHVLKDDQGELGVLSMESLERNMIPENKKELLSILVSQCTVALRNAELYTTVPSGILSLDFSQKIAAKLYEMKEWPLEKKRNTALGVLGIIFSLIFVKVPWNITTAIEIVPMASTYYAQSKGKVSEVFVKEGQAVMAEDVLLKLETEDLILERRQKESSLQKIASEMLKLQSEGKIGEFKIKESEKKSLNAELEMLDKQLEHSTVKAMQDGIVVSSNLDELVGMPVNFGQELVKIARTDRVFAQFEVPEDDVLFVKPGQGIKFKVFGLPNTSFSNDIKLKTVAGEGKSLTKNDTNKFFIARAEVPNHQNSGSVLRPGMTGRGKIYTPWQPLGYYLFSKPAKYIVMNLFY